MVINGGFWNHLQMICHSFGETSETRFGIWQSGMQPMEEFSTSLIHLIHLRFFGWDLCPTEWGFENRIT